ncbi:MAG: peptidylprolyl isomerase [Acidimicrobiales bacterium]
MPSEKRARQRAFKQARMEDLRRTQQRRRNLRRGSIVAVLVAIAVVLAIVTTGGGKSKPHASNKHPTPSTVAPLSSAALATNLIPRAAPPVSAACNVAPSSLPSTTTTVPANGNAVSVVAAPSTVPFPKLDGSSPRFTKFASAPPFCIDVNKTYQAKVTTDVGSFTISLLPKYAPMTVNNFVFLAGYQFFNNTVFHRVIPGFVDQGGDPTGTGSGGPGYKFADELPKSVAAYDNGALAMANSGTNTNGSQFFIVVGRGGAQLQPNYSMFGQITQGLSVAKKINDDGNPSPSANGVPPKVTHKIVKVTITES